MTRGLWVRCWTTFLYWGEHRVVKTNRVSVENVLNDSKREEQDLSFSKHPKNLKTVEYWKSYKRFSVELSDSKKSRYIYHACTMYTIQGYRCMVYMVNVTWNYWIRKSATKSFVTFSIFNRFQIFWMFWKAEILLSTFSTFSAQKQSVSITLHSPQYKKVGSVPYPYPPRH